MATKAAAKPTAKLRHPPLQVEIRKVTPPSQQQSQGPARLAGVLALLQARACPEDPNPTDGATALMLAARHGDTELCRLLMDFNADPQRKCFPRRAVDFAAELQPEQPELVELLSPKPPKHLGKFERMALALHNTSAAGRLLHIQARLTQAAAGPTRRAKLRPTKLRRSLSSHWDLAGRNLLDIWAQAREDTVQSHCKADLVRAIALHGQIAARAAQARKQHKVSFNLKPQVIPHLARVRPQRGQHIRSPEGTAEPLQQVLHSTARSSWEPAGPTPAARPGMETTPTPGRRAVRQPPRTVIRPRTFAWPLGDYWISDPEAKVEPADPLSQTLGYVPFPTPERVCFNVLQLDIETLPFDIERPLIDIELPAIPQKDEEEAAAEREDIESIPAEQRGPVKLDRGLLLAVTDPKPCQLRKMIRSHNIPGIAWRALDKDRSTLLHHCLTSKPTDAVMAAAALLMQHGAQVNARNSLGETPVMMAVRAALEFHANEPDGPHLRPLEHLLKAGADPNNADDLGETALIEAACVGDVVVGQLLLDYGADPSHRTKCGLTAIRIAELEKHTVLFHRLVAERDRRVSMAHIEKLKQQILKSRAVTFEAKKKAEIARATMPPVPNPIPAWWPLNRVPVSKQASVQGTSASRTPTVQASARAEATSPLRKETSVGMKAGARPEAKAESETPTKLTSFTGDASKGAAAAALEESVLPCSKGTAKPMAQAAASEQGIKPGVEEQVAAPDGAKWASPDASQAATGEPRKELSVGKVLASSCEQSKASDAAEQARGVPVATDTSEESVMNVPAGAISAASDTEEDDTMRHPGGMLEALPASPMPVQVGTEIPEELKGVPDTVQPSPRVAKRNTENTLMHAPAAQVTSETPQDSVTAIEERTRDRDASEGGASGGVLEPAEATSDATQVASEMYVPAGALFSEHTKEQTASEQCSGVLNIAEASPGSLQAVEESAMDPAAAANTPDPTLQEGKENKEVISMTELEAASSDFVADTKSQEALVEMVEEPARDASRAETTATPVAPETSKKALEMQVSAEIAAAAPSPREEQENKEGLMEEMEKMVEAEEIEAAHDAVCGASQPTQVSEETLDDAVHDTPQTATKAMLVATRMLEEVPAQESAEVASVAQDKEERSSLEEAVAGTSQDSVHDAGQGTAAEPTAEMLVEAPVEIDTETSMHAKDRDSSQTEEAVLAATKMPEEPLPQEPAVEVSAENQSIDLAQTDALPLHHESDQEAPTGAAQECGGPAGAAWVAAGQQESEESETAGQELTEELPECQKPEEEDVQGTEPRDPAEQEREAAVEQVSNPELPEASAGALPTTPGAERLSPMFTAASPAHPQQLDDGLLIGEETVEVAVEHPSGDLAVATAALNSLEEQRTPSEDQATGAQPEAEETCAQVAGDWGDVFAALDAMDDAQMQAEEAGVKVDAEGEGEKQAGDLEETAPALHDLELQAHTVDQASVQEPQEDMSREEHVDCRAGELKETAATLDALDAGQTPEVGQASTQEQEEDRSRDKLVDCPAGELEAAAAALDALDVAEAPAMNQAPTQEQEEDRSCEGRVACSTGELKETEAALDGLGSVQAPEVDEASTEEQEEEGAGDRQVGSPAGELEKAVAATDALDSAQELEEEGADDGQVGYPAGDLEEAVAAMDALDAVRAPEVHRVSAQEPEEERAGDGQVGCPAGDLEEAVAAMDARDAVRASEVDHVSAQEPEEEKAGNGQVGIPAGDLEEAVAAMDARDALWASEVDQRSAQEPEEERAGNGQVGIPAGDLEEAVAAMDARDAFRVSEVDQASAQEPEEERAGDGQVGYPAGDLEEAVAAMDARDALRASEVDQRSAQEPEEERAGDGQVSCPAGDLEEAVAAMDALDDVRAPEVDQVYAQKPEEERAGDGQVGCPAGDLEEAVAAMEAMDTLRARRAEVDQTSAHEPEEEGAGDTQVGCLTGNLEEAVAAMEAMDTLRARKAEEDLGVQPREEMEQSAQDAQGPCKVSDSSNWWEELPDLPPEAGALVPVGAGPSEKEMRLLRAVAPGQKLENLREACHEAGLSVAWCSDTSILQELLRNWHRWAEAGGRDLMRALAERNVPCHGVLEKEELQKRLRQALVWEAMPGPAFRNECCQRGMQRSSLPVARTECFKQLAQLVYGRPQAKAKQAPASSSKAPNAKAKAGNTQAQPTRATGAAPKAQAAKAPVPAVPAPAANRFAPQPHPGNQGPKGWPMPPQRPMQPQYAPWMPQQQAPQVPWMQQQAPWMQQQQAAWMQQQQAPNQAFQPRPPPGRGNAVGGAAVAKGPAVVGAPAAAAGVGRQAPAAKGNARAQAKPKPKPKPEPRPEPRPRPRREPVRYPSDSEQEDDCVDLTFCGPRIRKVCRSFPGYSGDLPSDAETAEEHWTDQELLNFFFSSGMIKPKRRIGPPPVTEREIGEHFQTLGLHLRDGGAAVKQRYKRLALEFHPDKNKNNPETTKRMQDITYAYNCIGRYMIERGQPW